MAADAGLVQGSVGAALRFVRGNLRFVAIVAAVFAVASTAISALSMLGQTLSIVAMVGIGLAQTFAYAALLGAALFGVEAARGRWSLDGWRVWSAMALIGLFLCIVMIVLTIPVSIVLAAGPMVPYVADLQAAGSDQAAVMAVMTRFLNENAGVMLLVMLFYGVVWLLLTSRLYLAAPASVEAGRMLTFETWKWTQGHTLKIVGARLMLLLPAYILMFALSALVSRALGFNALDAASVQSATSGNPIGIMIYQLINGFIVMALYASLEAGLSAHLYRGLKPPAD